MAQFDESKVINALHTDKAEVGKKYWYSDNIANLKTYVEGGLEKPSVLAEIGKGLFILRHNTCGFYLLYPYEEPSKKRMTHRMLAEWCAKGFGEYTDKDYKSAYTRFPYDKGFENYEVEENIIIRTWDSKEWQEPTEEFFLRDCRGVEV